MALSACTSARSGQDGFSYDPPGSTITTDKPITEPERRADWLDGDDVTISTDFDGARLSDVERTGPSSFTFTIRPENAPVNNSAWYAFRIQAEEPQTVTLRLEYENGDHRYDPKLSRDGEQWVRLEESAFQIDTTGVTTAAILTLEIGPEPIWVSGQELLTSSDLEAWSEQLATRSFVSRSAFAHSRQGHPLYKLEITETTEPSGYVILMGRQHPPEVSGQLALMAFVEAITGSSDLARSFRQRFEIVVVPMANPDGVDGGHWRHNAGGVDLNRDWASFNQPETQALRDEFLKLKADPEVHVYFAADFHSTQEDVFYTLAKDLPTMPDAYTDAWLAGIQAKVPEYQLNEEPFGLGDPVSKNWFYEQFGSPAVTYEVGDETERALIRRVAEAGAETMMELLLKAVP